MGWVKDKGNKPIFKEGGKVKKSSYQRNQETRDLRKSKRESKKELKRLEHKKQARSEYLRLRDEAEKKMEHKERQKWYKEHGLKRPTIGKLNPNIYET
jgi:seryl-tRNA synthetase